MVPLLTVTNPHSPSLWHFRLHSSLSGCLFCRRLLASVAEMCSLPTLTREPCADLRYCVSGPRSPRILNSLLGHPVFLTPCHGIYPQQPKEGPSLLLSPSPSVFPLFFFFSRLSLGPQRPFQLPQRAGSVVMARAAFEDGLCVSRTWLCPLSPVCMGEKSVLFSCGLSYLEDR